ncbi:hypothetical protein HPB50_026616 [Hyalomma asiaticum]|uniref:Uncharacterized protein n=1 Tax=Hyalomma asiaticum TaxID=266040 RepID=A0ACB7TPL6_HYAAI|nr:hypothetical protein HPB50_026616 [Hyalomma asiaticum]
MRRRAGPGQPVLYTSSGRAGPPPASIGPGRAGPRNYGLCTSLVQNPYVLPFREDIKHGKSAVYESRNTCKYFVFAFDTAIDLPSELWKTRNPHNHIANTTDA